MELITLKTFNVVESSNVMISPIHQQQNDMITDQIETSLNSIENSSLHEELSLLIMKIKKFIIGYIIFKMIIQLILFYSDILIIMELEQMTNVMKHLIYLLMRQNKII